MFISWLQHHGRSADLSEALGIEAVFLPEDIAKKNVFVRYLAAARYTRDVIRKGPPGAIFLMLPPAPALITVRLVNREKHRLIADLHTGYFSDPKWSWFAGFGMRLLRGSTVLVTNSYLADKCRNAGLESIVLHDVLVDRRGEESAGRASYILCPLSYANDEPVDMLLKAAELTPNIKYKFTGRPPQGVRRNAPTNVEFTGYVDDVEYLALLQNALAVAAITNRDHTMQRAGYEALMAGKPQITSNYPVLREFLGDAALYVDPSREREFASAVNRIELDPEGYIRSAAVVLETRMHEQAEVLKSLSRLTVTPTR